MVDRLGLRYKSGVAAATFPTPQRPHRRLKMSLRLGDTAPDFTADSTAGRIEFHKWLGSSWGVLFSHPKDFTPVCTTELGRLAKLAPEFQKRNVKVLGLSVDPVEDHKRWKSDIEETQNCKVDYPILADPDRKVATLYDMIHPGLSETFTVRSVFVIGPDKKIKLTLTYPMSAGRNFDELVRVLDSLQLSAKHPVATPADWRPGQEVIIALSVNDEDAKAKFPKGIRAPKPYLRFTPQPE